MKKYLQAFLLMVLLLSLAGCGGKPFIATGDGTQQTAEQATTSASDQVTAFFDQVRPIFATVVTSLAEMGNTVFSVMPGVGVDESEIEKVRQLIIEKQNNGG